MHIEKLINIIKNCRNLSPTVFYKCNYFQSINISKKINNKSVKKLLTIYFDDAKIKLVFTKKRNLSKKVLKKGVDKEKQL